MNEEIENIEEVVVEPVLKAVVLPKGSGVTIGRPVPRQYWRDITCDFQCHKDRTPPSNTPGIDYACPVGTQITAGHTGRVVVADNTDNSSKGKYVVVRFRANGKVWEIEYLHLSKVKVRVGQRVSKDSEIGRSGNTGRSTGPHLHWSVRRDGKLVDPKRYI
jgi:hypothetical protein